MHSNRSLVELSRCQYERFGDGSATTVIICAELIKLALRLQQKHGNDELGAITKGFLTANQEACDHTEKVLSKKSSTVAEVYKSVARTIMQTKLMQDDADLFSTLVAQIWQQHISVETGENRRNTAADAAYVKLVTFNGMQTVGSKVLNGNYLIVVADTAVYV